MNWSKNPRSVFKKAEKESISKYYHAPDSTRLKSDGSGAVNTSFLPFRVTEILYAWSAGRLKPRIEGLSEA